MKNIIREFKQKKLFIFILLLLMIFITSCNSNSKDNTQNSKSQDLSTNEKKTEGVATTSPSKSTQSADNKKTDKNLSKKNEKKADNLVGTWPDNDLAVSIPKPRDGLVRTVLSEEDKCAIYVTMTFSQCKTYLDDIIEDGYLYDESSYDELIKGKGGDIQFGKDDGKAFKLNYTSGLLKIMIFGY